MLRALHVCLTLAYARVCDWWAGGTEITESQLQILALAEEVERLQGLVVSERAAQDELRRRFLRVSAPRPPPNAGIADHTTERMRAEPETRTEDVAPSTATATKEQRQHVSVVGRAQQARQSADAGDRLQQAPTQPRKRGFSIWGFITGEDRIGT